jgi:hypothetical protein
MGRPYNDESNVAHLTLGILLSTLAALPELASR